MLGFYIIVIAISLLFFSYNRIINENVERTDFKLSSGVEGGTYDVFMNTLDSQMFDKINNIIANSDPKKVTAAFYKDKLWGNGSNINVRFTDLTPIIKITPLDENEDGVFLSIEKFTLVFELFILLKITWLLLLEKL